MTPFYECGLTASRLQSYHGKAAYFLPLSSKKFLALTWSTAEGSKTESILETPSGFEHETLVLGIQHLNHLRSVRIRA